MGKLEDHINSSRSFIQSLIDVCGNAQDIIFYKSILHDYDIIEKIAGEELGCVNSNLKEQQTKSLQEFKDYVIDLYTDRDSYSRGKSLDLVKDKAEELFGERWS